MGQIERDDVYRRLEERMLGRGDYVDIPVNDCGEALVPVPASVDSKQIGEDMRSVTGDVILVREGVARRLARAARLLSRVEEGLWLQVVYGYRTPCIQRQLFQAEMAKLAGQYDGDELIEQTHRRIASPGVAGHPTGGAVDIQIINPDGRPLEFGTRIWDFSKDSYTNSPFVGARATMYRQLLRTVMIANGFAPFEGEWWHFSYGDKEWAKRYGQENAKYGQICEGDMP